MKRRLAQTDKDYVAYIERQLFVRTCALVCLIEERGGSVSVSSRDMQRHGIGGMNITAEETNGSLVLRAVMPEEEE